MPEDSLDYESSSGKKGSRGITYAFLFASERGSHSEEIDQLGGCKCRASIRFGRGFSLHQANIRE
jgi:hypothetical protein